MCATTTARLVILTLAVGLSPLSHALAAGTCPTDVPGTLTIPAFAGGNLPTSAAHAVVTAATPSVFHCFVEGEITIDDAPGATPIRFNLFLPDSGPGLPLLGRLVVLGNGGFSGSLATINSARVQEALAAGLAVADTDSGHTGGGPARWASGAPVERKNYHYQAMHLVTVTAKAIVDAYYTPLQGDQPTFTYFDGCSNGGREGLIEAQEFPDDFDGILAGAPAIGRSDQALLGAIPYSQANFADGYLSPVESPLYGLVSNAPLQSNSVFPAPSRIFNPDVNNPFLLGVIPGKLEAVSDTVLDLCDGLDGLIDGILDDPRTCSVPDVLEALPRGECPGCFTDPEIELLRLLYGPHLGVPGAEDTPLRGFDRSIDADFPAGPFVPLGLRDPVSGQRPPTLPFPVQVCSVPPFFLPPFFCPGPDGLANLAPGLRGGGGVPFNESVLRYFVFDTDPLLPVSVADRRSFMLDFDLSDEESVELFRARMGDGEGLNPDLREFRDKGGKLIMYMGWADLTVGPMHTVNYYEDVARMSGGSPQEFARLFMVPGMHHCIPGGGDLDPGPVPERSDVFAELIRWVESGVAPDSFAGVRTAPPFPFRRESLSRPICSYPEVARQIDPDGSETDAANFRCVNVPLPVEIDIKPGSDPNCINDNGHGVIPVAILTSDYFDASKIDASTVLLDGQAVRVTGRLQAHSEDVDGDGDEDLVVQIEKLEDNYPAGAASGVLTGQTFAGTLIEGTDSLCFAPD